MQQAIDQNRSPEQDVNSLFETALLQRTMVSAVDPVAGDGHEMTAARHCVAQNRQVPIIHV